MADTYYNSVFVNIIICISRCQYETCPHIDIKVHFLKFNDIQ